MTRIGDILGISSTEKTLLEASSWESEKGRFEQELSIFCCWLGGHAIIRRHTQTKWHLCRCGQKLVSEEELWLRYKAPEPDLEKAMGILQDGIRTQINMEFPAKRWDDISTDPAEDIRKIV